MQGLVIINLVREHVRRNGPCIIPEYGAAYAHKNNVDPIGALTGLQPKHLQRYYKVISDPSCKKLIVTIGSRFKVNLSDSMERTKFVKFLQAIQDAHDFNFDPFYKIESMEGFLQDLHCLEMSLNN